MTQDAETQAALKVWRDGLVGLTRQSALIKFRAPRSSSLLIDNPSLDDILKRIQSGRPQAFRGDLDPNDPESARPLPAGTYFHSPRPDREIGPIVRNLMRRAATEFLERGLSVLYLAFGILDWQDIDGTAMVSPLLLVPVQLIPEGPKATPRIAEGEDDAVLNPALALRLREFGIELPPVDEIEGLSVMETLDAIRSVLETANDFGKWTLHERAHLATFSFAKEAMFRDLLDNEAIILEHPIVRALATSDVSQQTSNFQFEPVDPAEIDKVAPPEKTPLVLDADSSQRVAVAASLAGRTFVMDGPPGTGKSQTIANMIGALLHAGKTVLFVSEKIAALDVVRNRLTAAGLGSYLLELHSHKSSRKEVSTELLRTLDHIAVPPVGMPAAERAKVKQRRERLNEYSAAMNEVRAPLEKSVHEVLGVYAGLTDVAMAPVPEKAPIDLSASDYSAIQETLARLVRAWRPAAQGNSFLWREAVDEHSLEVRLYHAESALEEMRGTAVLNADVMNEFMLTKPSDIPRLAALIDHNESPLSLSALEQWLTAETLVPLESLRADLGRDLGALRAAEAEVQVATNVRWSAFPLEHALPPNPDSLELSPRQVDVSSTQASELLHLAEKFANDARMLRERETSLNALASDFGLPALSTFADANLVMRLVDLRSQNALCERAWFTPVGLDSARRAAAEMRDHVAHLDAAEAKAAGTFTTAALQAPLADLQDRFTNLHKGLRKLSGSYRADKRTMSALLTNAADVKNGIDHIADAIAWGESTLALDSAASARGELLGQYWAGRETDFSALESALNVAQEVLTLTDDQPPTLLVASMVSPTRGDAHKVIVDRAREDLSTWSEGLSLEPSLAGRPELLLGKMDTAADWLFTNAGSMRTAAVRSASIGKLTGRDLTLTEANALIALSEATRLADARLRSREPLYQEGFGAHFSMGDTDLPEIDRAIEWATQLRVIARGPLSPAQIRSLRDAAPVKELMPSHERWTAARDRVVAAFGTTRHAELTTELDDYRDAVELMGALRDDSVGQQEWFDFKSAYGDLASRSLDTAIDFCIERRVSADEVPDVANRALLRAWADAVIQSDGRLRPLLAGDRDALVEEYRDLDRDLVKAATSDIIISANARRPINTTMGESGVIRREGGKQKRHRPVREVMALTRNVTPSIKPVFMMSPLAVSQYLPPDMVFDVVIFDEASQVTPGDAINCVYRGRSLILAGDDKQLPPTSFFERNVDDDDQEETDVQDFQSVLELAKASGALNNLGLRWHYRSRHEDLIAFSNYKFYEGKLVTFPSARAEGPDVGVEFFHAHGMYKRGGGAFNPLEAAEVARRVIDHFTERPNLTLGVVTFSVAQADAVQNAIDEARLSRRDLDRFFDTEDRLDGFFIRALEQVQGDERDVIIFSVGYGPDEAGKISTNFGALNKAKGWRRLNVGVTRARQRVEVVASMRAAQIPPSSNENVEYFRAYLDYAEKGPQVLAIPYASTGLDPESPFEESVLNAIRGWGYDVEPQVGAAGFRIDLGVRHPALPGSFAIGVECDGYQYHSAPAARDRDRLRDQVLSGLGWRLHRIWGTAWYRDRPTEESRLRAAIEHAIASPEGAVARAVTDRPVVETELATIAAAPTWTFEYELAPVQRLPRWVDPGESGNHLHMVEPLRILVAEEGPVHVEIAYERLRQWWDIGRVGSNIRNNIELAAIRANIVRDGDFFVLRSGRPTEVRTPSAVANRKVEQVHLDELAMASVLTIRDVGAVTRVEVVQGVARIFGWSRTGSIVERRISEAIDSAIAGEEVIDRDGTLTLRESWPSPK